eukprot:COSAG01_NODE_10122_length_2245_cov_1.955266_2_plen_86_part_00
MAWHVLWLPQMHSEGCVGGGDPAPIRFCSEKSAVPRRVLFRERSRDLYLSTTSHCPMREFGNFPFLFHNGGWMVGWALLDLLATS